MGLLQKASEQKINTPEFRKDKFPEIKDKLNKIKDRIEFYPTIFKELVSLFSIEKGALLLKEGDMFSLNSIIGFDETTRNRLRLSHSEYESYIKSNDNNILKGYFSIREFMTINKIILIPFKSSNTLSGILLITEFLTENPPEDSEIELYTEELQEFFIENPLVKLKNVESQSNDIKESITSYLQKIKNSENRVIIFKLNLGALIDKIREEDKLSTSSSIINSSIKLLSSFLKNRGKVFQLYNNDILLTLLDNKETTNIMIVQQQINAAFKSIFSNKLSTINLNFESLIWKNNSLETILDNFIQDENS